jgi:hypothetical protein
MSENGFTTFDELEAALDLSSQPHTYDIQGLEFGAGLDWAMSQIENRSRPDESRVEILMNPVDLTEHIATLERLERLVRVVLKTEPFIPTGQLFVCTYAGHHWRGLYRVEGWS